MTQKTKTGRAVAVACACLIQTACVNDDGESGSETAKPAIQRPPTVSEAAAIRFLNQSSFGPTSKSIQRVIELGFSSYIDEQLSLPSSTYAKPETADSGMSVLQERFFYNAINGEDQLRQRMAFALGQIFVVSSRGLSMKDGIYSYQSMLMDQAFGNYGGLLRAVTIHPSMGAYLDLANNGGESPNENYAREMMQLFTVGTAKLNLDGSEQRHSNGNPIPTYTQEEVEGLARALTGWTYPTRPGETTRRRNPKFFYGQMIPSDSLHDYGPKRLLSGTLLPAGQSIIRDLDDALAAVMAHPNVAPFVCSRLIQHFVTSNPSPDYVRRVAQVFNDNGDGGKGDLRAVITAILLDPEARRGDDPSRIRPTDGKLKEPALFITGLIRSLDARSRGYKLNRYSANMGQSVFSAPSVFNFYPPDYRLREAPLLGPEFKLRSGQSVVGAINFVNEVVFGLAPNIAEVELAPWIALASDTEALLDAINLRLLHGSMSAAMRSTIEVALGAFPEKHTAQRTHAALYLTATSSQYAIQF